MSQRSAPRKARENEDIHVGADSAEEVEDASAELGDSVADAGAADASAIAGPAEVTGGGAESLAEDEGDDDTAHEATRVHGPTCGGAPQPAQNLELLDGWVPNPLLKVGPTRAPQSFRTGRLGPLGRRRGGRRSK